MNEREGEKKKGANMEERKYRRRKEEVRKEKGRE